MCEPSMTTEVTTCQKSLSMDDGISTQSTVASRPSTPEQLPFTEDDSRCSISESSKQAFIQHAREQRLHSRRHRHLQHHDQQHGHSHPPVKALASGSNWKGPRRQEITPSLEADQPADLVAPCSPPIIHDDAIQGPPTVPDIITTDIESRSPGGRPLCTPESSIFPSREQPQLRSSTQETLPEPTWESGPLEPDDDKPLEQYVGDSLEVDRDALGTPELPLGPSTVGHNETLEDEGFFDGPGSPRLGGILDGAIQSLGAHHVDGLLRFGRSFHGIPNGSPVVRNVPRMRRRWKNKKRRRTAAETGQEATTDEHAVAAGNVQQ